MLEEKHNFLIVYAHSIRLKLVLKVFGRGLGGNLSSERFPPINAYKPLIRKSQLFQTGFLEDKAMEFILGIVIIVVLCIILGVRADFMIIGALGILGLIVLATALFFIIFMGILLFSKKKEAVFGGVEKKDDRKFKTAVYIIEGKEYQCFFPAEPEFVYKKDKTYRVMLNRRLGRVFDGFAITTCICGFLFSIAAITGAVMLVLWII